MKMFKILAALAVLSTPASAATFNGIDGWELSSDWLTTWSDDVSGIEDGQNGITYLGAEIGVYELHSEQSHQIGLSISGYDGSQSGSVTFGYFGGEIAPVRFAILLGTGYSDPYGNILVTVLRGDHVDYRPFAWNADASSRGNVYGNDDLFLTAQTNLESNWTPPVAAVPLPAGGLLILTALGGLAAVKRRASATVS